MDIEILHAIWFNCPDLTDTEHKLLLALAHHCYHGLTCHPSVRRLSQMIRRKPRQTRALLRELEKKGYITIHVERGRGHSNRYIINRQKLLPILEKIGSLDCRSKSAIAIAAELELEEERKKTRAQDEEDFSKDVDITSRKIKAFLRSAGICETSAIYKMSLNGHNKGQED